MGDEPLHREYLDLMKCACGKTACEEPVILHSICHPKEATWVSYYGGNITVTCSLCEKVIAVIAVASSDSLLDYDASAGPGWSRNPSIGDGAFGLWS